MESTIHVYGEKAQSIEEGERFTAHVTSVEGRKVVFLQSARCGSSRSEPL